MRFQRTKEYSNYCDFKPLETKTMNSLTKHTGLLYSMNVGVSEGGWKQYT